MKHKPHKHQLAGSSWLAVQNAGILADEVGLGKTYSALLTTSLLRAKTILVICPNSLKEQWASEIEKFLGHLNPTIKMLVRHRGDLTPSIYAQGDGPTFWIGNYAQFRTSTMTRKAKRKSDWKPTDFTAFYLDKSWDVVIVDEVHNLSNRRSQRTYWIKKLKTAAKIGLTGTPIRERPDQMWSLLNWLDPKKFSSYWRFVENYCKLDEGYGSRRYKKIVGLKHHPNEQGIWTTDITLKLLSEEVKDYVLVRKLDDVGLTLPPLTVSDVTVEIKDSQAELYKEVKENAVIQLTNDFGQSDTWDLTGNNQLFIRSAAARYIRLLRVTSAGTAFRADTSNAKLDALKTMLEGTDEGFVIMTRFRHTADKVRELVQKLGRTQDKIGTFGKLSTGHNLQDYRLSVFFDAPQSRVEWEQACGRTHRLGQERPQTIYRLRARGTVDDHAWGLIDDKQRETDMILSWLRGLQKGDD